MFCSVLGLLLFFYVNCGISADISVTFGTWYLSNKFGIYDFKRTDTGIDHIHSDLFAIGAKDNTNTLIADCHTESDNGWSNLIIVTSDDSLTTTVKGVCNNILEIIVTYTITSPSSPGDSPSCDSDYLHVTMEIVNIYNQDINEILIVRYTNWKMNGRVFNDYASVFGVSDTYLIPQLNHGGATLIKSGEAFIDSVYTTLPVSYIDNSTMYGDTLNNDFINIGPHNIHLYFAFSLGNLTKYDSNKFEYYLGISNNEENAINCIKNDTKLNTKLYAIVKKRIDGNSEVGWMAFFSNPIINSWIKPCSDGIKACNCNKDVNCKVCNNNPNEGCSQCDHENGFFKLDEPYPCSQCQKIFGDECLHCARYNGCQQCKDGYTREYDPDNDLYFCKKL